MIDVVDLKESNPFPLSAVFFTIFSQIFEFELGNIGFGADIDTPTGFGLFLRMSAGAVVVGSFFAAGLLIMVYMLDRKFNYEESIVQVSASITAGMLSHLLLS